jgi:hypothetical protein
MCIRQIRSLLARGGIDQQGSSLQADSPLADVDSPAAIATERRHERYDSLVYDKLPVAQNVGAIELTLLSRFPSADIPISTQSLALRARSDDTATWRVRRETPSCSLHRLDWPICVVSNCGPTLRLLWPYPRLRPKMNVAMAYLVWRPPLFIFHT